MLQKRILRVVLASPGDVQAERDTLPTVIDELNRGIASERNLLLELHRWETDAYPGFHPDGPQGLIDPILQIEDCDILIGVFWKRFGTPTEDAQSGTEHEILSAYQAWQQNRRPQIMVYFNQKAYTPKLKGEIDQWGRVLDFKQRFPKEGLWWEYRGKAQFERLVRNHLTQIIRHQYPLHQSPPSHAWAGQSPEGQERRDALCRSTDELTQEYLANLDGHMSTVYLFGEEEPRALDKIFVELSIVGEYRRPTVHDEFLGLMDAEMRRRRSAFARLEEERGAFIPGGESSRGKFTVKPDELLRAGTKAIVTGAPGSGKTTLLRYLVRRTHEAGERLPVFLELKAVTADDFTRARCDLAELLFEEGIAGKLNLRGAEREGLRESFTSRLAAGEAAIFLDGLDEVSGTDFFPQLRESVVEFVRRVHRDNTLVISTRPYALPSRLEGLKGMEIAPLNQRQVEEFFAHYYGGEPEAQRLMRTLWQRRPLRELLRVPFLLVLIAQLYRRERRVVEDRLELYQQIVLQLAVQLDREKLTVYRDFRISDRDGKLKLGFLKYLAGERLLIDDVRAEEGGESARLVFNGELILDKARQFWEGSGRPAYNYYDLADDVKATPLLREVGTDVYAFAHLTIQEYLAAAELVRRTNHEEIFCRAYFNSTLAGMEVLPMTLGLTHRPEKLYTALEQLPESIAVTDLRLRARGLAYVRSPDRGLLIRLANHLLELVNERKVEETIYTDVILRSFTEARTASLNLIVEPLAALLQGHHSSVRERAAEALGEIGGEHAVDALLDALRNDAASGVRWRAAVALGEIGDERAVDALLGVLLKEPISFVRGRAAEALGQLGDKRAVPALLPLLKDADKIVRWRAAVALGKLGDERIVEALLDVLRDDSDYSAGQGAVEAISHLGGERAVDALLPLLKDANSHARQRAAKVLGEIGDARAVPELLPLLKDTERDVRGSAAVALSRLGYERAMEALLDVLLEKTAVFSCLPVIEELGRLGDERAIPALCKVILTDLLVYDRAAKALGRIGGERAVGALLPHLKSPLDFVRERVVVGLAYLGDKRVVPELLTLVKKESVKASWSIGNAVDALGKVSDENTVPALLMLLKDKHRFVRERAVMTLGEIDESALREGLVRSLSNKDKFVRRQAALVVGYYAEGEDVLRELTRMAAKDRSKTVRIAANEARAKYERKLAHFR
jgi:HEAT repeat protein